MRLFVTGTDTGVGKTVVTSCLARAARARGSVAACKPIASGVERGTPGDDAVRIAEAAGHLPLVFASYVAPLSPHRAALEEGRALDSDALRAWLAAQQADTVLIEGAGGWRVPVGGGVWMADLARGCDVVIVAADRLGVLNHTLLTAEAVRADGLRVAAVVLDRAVPEDRSRRTNLDDLTELAGAPVIALSALDLADHEAVRMAGAAILRGIVDGERG